MWEILVIDDDGRCALIKNADKGLEVTLSLNEEWIGKSELPDRNAKVGFIKLAFRDLITQALWK